MTLPTSYQVCQTFRKGNINMLNLDKLIQDIQNLAANNTNVTININVGAADTIVDERPATDFTVGDRVLICHIRKDGTGTKHTHGTVDAVLQQDEYGWYTRVTGDNGKHYRTGLVIDEERKGSKVVCFVRD